MGFLGDFAGGAADAGAGIIGNQIRTDQASEAAQANAKFNADLDVAKRQTIDANTMTAQNANADLLRTQKSARIGGQLQSDVDSNVGPAPDALPSTQSDGTPMPAEAQASYATAQGILNKQRGAYTSDGKNMLQAAVETGDETPDKLASLQTTAAVQAAKNDAYMDKLSYLTSKADADNTTKLQIAQLAHAVKTAGAGNTDFDKKVNLWRTAGKSDSEIADLISERKQPSLEDLATAIMKNDPNAGTTRAISPEDAVTKARQLRVMTAGSSAAPSPAKPAPQGMTLIGHTADGRSVYQGADGKRYAQ